LLFNTLFFTKNSSTPNEEHRAHGYKPRRRDRAVGDPAQQPQQDAVGAPSSGSAYSFRTGCHPPLNRSTVASLIAELAARGLVWERSRDKPAPQPTPGRPSPVVEICREGPAALALELSTDWIRAAVIGLGAFVAVSVSKDLSLASSTPEQAVDEAHDLVGPILARLDHGPRVAAIGVSAPGAIRAEDGYIYHAPNLGWRDVPLGSMIGSRFADLGVPCSWEMTLI